MKKVDTRPLIILVLVIIFLAVLVSLVFYNVGKSGGGGWDFGLTPFEMCVKNGGQIWPDGTQCTDEYGDHVIPDNLAEQQCMERGGEWTWGEVYFCRMPVADEGSMCTDSSQCEDICKVETLEDTAGVCTAFSGGCDIVLENGKTSWLCS